MSRKGNCWVHESWELQGGGSRDVVHKRWSSEHSMRSAVHRCRAQSCSDDLRWGSSILRFCRFCKLLIGSALRDGSPHWPHWTISAIGSSGRPRESRANVSFLRFETISATVIGCGRLLDRAA